MKFGDLRSMIHRGELPPLFATLPEKQQRYVESLAGKRLAARTERLRLAEWLVYAEDPLYYKTRKKIDPALDPLLRWYSCDVASETMRMHGNGDPQSLRAIEVARAYVLGKASKEDLQQAQRDATADAYAYAAHTASDVAAHAAAAAVYAAAEAAAHAAYDAAYVTAADAAVHIIYYRKHKTLLTNWLRTYLMRWIEEGNWWEVPS